MEPKIESKYERLRKIGIGSYGVVFKCVNRQTGRIVAIKRYSENDTDPIIRKIAMREVQMLRQLKHPNLINLIEVFRWKRRLHLVFDYCELTVLDVIEKYGNNCPLNLVKKIIWQTINGINYCHTHNCIHRDIKPENILINQSGVVKLCDFGFARNVVKSNGTSALQNKLILTREALPLGSTNNSDSSNNKENTCDEPSKIIFSSASDRQALTEYVATRWYRAPELLIGETYYDIKIDIWAIGCVTAELMRGEPIWPGKTDLDQICIIKNSLGQLTSSQTQTLLTQNIYDQVSIERLLNQTSTIGASLKKKLPVKIGQSGIDFVTACLQMDPTQRPTSDELLKHPYIHSIRMTQFMKEAGHIAGRYLSPAVSKSVTSDRTSTVALAVPTTSESKGQNLLPQSQTRLNSQSLMLATGSSLLSSSSSSSLQPQSSKRFLVANTMNSNLQPNANGKTSSIPLPSALQPSLTDQKCQQQQQKQHFGFYTDTGYRYKRKQSINNHVNCLTSTTQTSALPTTWPSATSAEHKSLLPIAKIRNRANVGASPSSTTTATKPAATTTTITNQQAGKSSRRRREVSKEKSPTKIMSKEYYSQSNGNLLAIKVVNDGSGGDDNCDDSPKNLDDNKNNKHATNNNNQLTCPRNEAANRDGHKVVRSTEKDLEGKSKRTNTTLNVDSSGSSSYSDSLGTVKSSSISFLPSVFQYESSHQKHHVGRQSSHSNRLTDKYRQQVEFGTKLKDDKFQKDNNNNRLQDRMPTILIPAKMLHELHRVVIN